MSDAIQTIKLSPIVFLFITIPAFGQDLLTSQQQSKQAIEYRLTTERNKIIFLAKIQGDSVLRRINDNKWPDNIETIYNILKNPEGQVVYIGEFPTSQSGDWNLQLEHFFDDNGTLIAFQKYLSYFNESCTTGIIIETILELYDSNFTIINTFKTLTDKKGKDLTSAECGHGYNWAINKRPTVGELMKLTGIDLINQ